ncbi:MAG: ribbon-helix-helix protein, CopG family [Thermoplasmatales archaeon]|jgi:metal-responsive CopG/Arc/MetJ family transcriptional regulator|nr:ribbon-helix-helix protein, CopG family [Candidatus Thermoplasmatota archaeon]MDA8054836.1 ribbon-helix-helix protein, CopG family [Thermoplasmatales archaeon]
MNEQEVEVKNLRIIGITMSLQLLERLDRFAKESGLQRAQVIKVAVSDYLRQRGA